MKDSFADLGNTMLLKDRVYRTLKTEIILGHFKAGQRLNMLELANSMNISSAPIREALNMLCKDGFVILNPRKQAIVAESNLDGWQVLTDLRRMLEPYAARLSAGHIPPADIAAARAMVEKVIENPADVYAYVASDMAVHELIHANTGSKVLSDILTTVKEHSMRIRDYAEKFDDEDSPDKMKITVTSSKEHLKILDALETKDPDIIYREVLSHISNHISRVVSHEKSLNQQP